MPIFQLENSRISEFYEMHEPKVLKREILVNAHAELTIIQSRQTISNIINGHDSRKLIICGPCSIHNRTAALDYAYELNQLRLKYQDELFIVMRVYFEKPRTRIGWKGFINDPKLNGTHDMCAGLYSARDLLAQIVSIGLPVATEWLDTITPHYLGDLVSIGMIGARTTESQVHRQLVSGMSMPVGFKNNIAGDVQVACDAVASANNIHTFLGTSDEGKVARIQTRGNSDCFIVLRGSSHGPNYSDSHVSDATSLAKATGVNTRIVIDCSHGNSKKDYKNQPMVFDNVASQMIRNSNVVGLMIESNIHEGSQPLNTDPLRYGVSITDSCISLQTTKELFEHFYWTLQIEKAPAMVEDIASA